MAMGISYEDFWKLNPRSLTVILNGYKMKRKVMDEQNWLLGGYVFSAVSIAMGNAFKKKSQKSVSYFEELKHPFLKDIDKDKLSEEEIQKKRQLLFAQLRTKQANFEINHGK